AAAIPAAVRTRELDVRELIDGEIAGRLLPAAERELETAARLVSETLTAATAMVGDVELLTDVHRRQDGKDGTPDAQPSAAAKPGRAQDRKSEQGRPAEGVENFRAGLERIQSRCEELLSETVEALARAAE